jgi:hypothetical protein
MRSEDEDEEEDFEEENDENEEDEVSSGAWLQAWFVLIWLRTRDTVSSLTEVQMVEMMKLWGETSPT